MADKNKNNYLYIGVAVVVVIVLAIVFISNSNNNSQNEVTCNSPYIKVGTSCCLDQNSNGICDSDEIPAQNKQAQATTKELNIQDVEGVLEEAQPDFHGAFVKLESSDPCAYNGFFTGSRGSCEIWMYPAKEVYSDSEGNIFSAMLFRFNSDIPNINNDPFVYFQGGWSSDTLETSKGIVKKYERTTENSYSKDFHFVCGNDWIYLHYFSTTSSTFGKDSSALNIANKILVNC